MITAEADIQRKRAEQRQFAEARLAQATILAQYMRLMSPYTGVVTEPPTFTMVISSATPSEATSSRSCALRVRT